VHKEALRCRLARNACPAASSKLLPDRLSNTNKFSSERHVRRQLHTHTHTHTVIRTRASAEPCWPSGSWPGPAVRRCRSCSPPGWRRVSRQKHTHTHTQSYELERDEGAVVPQGIGKGLCPLVGDAVVAHPASRRQCKSSSKPLTRTKQLRADSHKHLQAGVAVQAAGEQLGLDVAQLVVAQAADRLISSRRKGTTHTHTHNHTTTHNRTHTQTHRHTDTQTRPTLTRASAASCTAPAPG
jgi:hypothetical protein